MLILLFIMNLKMTVGRSKRHSFLTLTFLVKSVCKNLLIRIAFSNNNETELTKRSSLPSNLAKTNPLGNTKRY